MKNTIHPSSTDNTSNQQIKQPIAFDTETTALNHKFGSITQFACKKYSGDSTANTPVHIADLRIPRGTLIEPEAILKTGMSFRDVTDPSKMSSYIFAKKLNAYFDKNPNTIWAAFNSKFDVDFIQSHQYKNAFDPYAMKKDGRNPFDVRPLFLLGTMLNKNGKGLILPTRKNGNYDSTQEGLALANGLPTYNAHNAGADVQTLDRLLHLALNCNASLRACFNSCQHKDSLRRNAQNSHFFLTFAYSKTSGPSLNAQVVLGCHPKYRNQDLCIRINDLSLEDISAGKILEEIQQGSNDVHITAFKPNLAPLIVIANSPLANLLISPEQESKYHQITSTLTDLKPQLLAAASEIVLQKIKAYKTPEYPEEAMVSGGFFNTEDQKLLKKFHDAAPQDKFALVERLSDERLIYFCKRIIHDNWPETLPAKVLKNINDELFWRLTTREAVPWLTISKALEKIEAIAPNCLVQPSQLLAEYRADLIDLQTNPIKQVG